MKNGKLKLQTLASHVDKKKLQIDVWRILGAVINLSSLMSNSTPLVAAAKAAESV